MQNKSNNNSAKKNDGIFSNFTISTLLAFFLVITIIFVFFYLNITRYKLTAKSIDLGDSITASMLLSPEIASAVKILI